MSGLLYGIAILFLVVWAVGFLFTNVGAVIHILLVLAIVAAVYSPLIRRRSV